VTEAAGDRSDDTAARLDAVVMGRVQGVGFRYYVVREARRLDLDGWTANEGDGSVRVVADGPRDTLEALLAVLREGPPASIVEQVVVNWPPVSSGGWLLGRGFEIRSGSHRGD
jgi:acylphosphatase